MGKRKQHATPNTQEHCDVWLSTADKKAQVSRNKRQRVLSTRPISNISNIVFSSQPIKAGTKQTSIQNFFGQKTAPGKENVAKDQLNSDETASATSPVIRDREIKANIVENDIVSAQPTFSLLDSSITKDSCDFLVEKRGVKKEQLKTSPGLESSDFQGINNLSSHTEGKSSRERQTNDIETQDLSSGKCTEEDDASVSDDSDGNAPFREPTDDPPVCLTGSDIEDVEFTMASQGYLRVKEPSGENDSNRKESFRAGSGDIKIRSTAASSHKCPSVKHLGLLSSSEETSSPQISTESPDSFVCDRTDTEDVAFTMASQGYLKVKEPCQQSSSLAKHSTIARAYGICSNDDVMSTAPKHLLVRSASNLEETESSQILTDSEDVEFTMATQGYLKVRDSSCLSKAQLANPAFRNKESNFDLAHNSPDTPSPVDSDDVDFTMSSQGYLKVKETSRDEDFMDTWKTINTSIPELVKESELDFSTARSISPGSLLHGDTEDVAFTMTSQGCLKVNDVPYRSKVRDLSLNEQYVIRNTKSNCYDHTKGQNDHSSSTPVTMVFTDTEDVDFTMSSEGCLKVQVPTFKRDKVSITKDSGHNNNGQLFKSQEGNNAGLILHTKESTSTCDFNPLFTSTEITESPFLTDSQDVDFI